MHILRDDAFAYDRVALHVCDGSVVFVLIVKWCELLVDLEVDVLCDSSFEAVIETFEKELECVEELLEQAVDELVLNLWLKFLKELLAL